MSIFSETPKLVWLCVSVCSWSAMLPDTYHGWHIIGLFRGLALTHFHAFRYSTISYSYFNHCQNMAHSMTACLPWTQWYTADRWQVNWCVFRASMHTVHVWWVDMPYRQMKHANRVISPISSDDITTFLHLENELFFFSPTCST